MNTSERTYSQLFALLRDTPQAAVFAPEEIQSLIEQPSIAPAPEAARFAPTTRRIAIVIAAFAVSIGGLLLLPVATPVHDNVPAPARRLAGATPENNAVREPRQSAPGTLNVPAQAIAPGTLNVPAQAIAPGTLNVTAPVSPVASTTGNIGGTANGVARTQHVQTLADRPAQHYLRPSPPRSVERLAPPVNAARDNGGAVRDLEISQPRVTTLPMLELNPEELKALGVTFNGGEIETAGEEYYSLATDADRATFAQMGMDTTKRSGIVRMRLSIDTFGLTTKKYSWTRVDNYSHIAPIFALNSYVRGEHSNAVALASFNHSPILDLAKSSNGSMVNVRSKMLGADNRDRTARDGDQANPARILVPVHIRLGDEPIEGTTMRRGADVILWYYPTPEFAAALPERYRISLQQELNAMADVVECHLPPGEACRQMTGEPLLLNYCKRNAGALRGLAVSPNPANGEVTVNYVLESQRTIVVGLYGIHGEYVRELVPAATMSAGSHIASLQLGRVASGAYMVVLRSEQGEQVSERLIVQ